MLTLFEVIVLVVPGARCIILAPVSWCCPVFATAIEIDSAEALARVLFERLKLTPPKAGPSKDQAKQQRQSAPPQAPDSTAITAPLPPRVFGHESIPDPLEPLREAHPVMEPLLEYRQLEASSARLAPPDLYERIRDGKVELPVTRIRATLQRGFTPE